MERKETYTEKERGPSDLQPQQQCLPLILSKAKP